MDRKKRSIEDIVRRKDRSVNCPRCWERMRYKRAQGKMAKWSPGLYAHYCKPCNVYVLDGSIDPDEDTWDRKNEENNRSRFSSYLSSIFKSSKK